MTPVPPALECRDVAVAYDGQRVLHSINLEVVEREVVAVLGPSGSGKTTLLYAVAGFVEPAEGEIWLAGRRVAAAGHSDPPEARDVGFVFQHYALWPHLDALQTVAYPLRRRGQAASEAAAQARGLLDRMGIGELAHRRPAELSGGQQQRVGVARALAGRPGLYLFDEPTAHLDTALRLSLQEELAEQRRETAAAALYATHDSGEALALADRVVLLREGRIVQVGSPQQVYDQPVDLWAARLTGPASVIEVEVAFIRDGQVAIRLDGHRLKIPGMVDSGQTSLLVRPDWAKLGGSLPGKVIQVWYRGPHTDYRIETPAGQLDVRADGPPVARVGERVGWSLLRAWGVE